MIQTTSIYKRLHTPKYTFQRIAFYGPMAVGKTYCANYLENKGYEKFSLAAKLKAICAELYDIKDKNNTSRKILQDVGIDLRKHDPDVWIKYLLNALKIGHQDCDIVVDDLRFQNEAEWFRENGFILVLVTADENKRRDRIEELYPDMNPMRMDHASEQDWKEISPDFVLDSTTGAVRYQIEGMLSNVTYRPRWER